MDAHKNFAISTVATAPSPATSGTSLVVAAADGAKFPTPPFNATVWPIGTQPTTTNAEIVRVTNIATDTFTITRTQESTAARSITVGDQISATITSQTLTDVETVASAAVPQSNTPAGAAAAFIFKQEAATFLSVVDPFLKIGYNVGAVVTAEPQWYLGIEGDYKIASGAEGWDSTGTHLLHEAYFNYASPDGTSVVNFRPIYMGVLRDTNASHSAHISFDIGTEGFPNSQLLFQAGVGNVLSTLTSAGWFFPAAGAGFDVKVGANFVQSMPNNNTIWSAPWTNLFATTMTTNRLYIMGVYIEVPCTITGVAVYNDSVAAGNILVGMYSADGATKIRESSSTAMSGTFNVQRIPFTSTYAATPGLYFITIMNSSNTGRWAQGNPFGRASTVDPGSFANPATITPPGTTLSSQIPILATY